MLIDCLNGQKHQKHQIFYFSKFLYWIKLFPMARRCGKTIITFLSIKYVKKFVQKFSLSLYQIFIFMWHKKLISVFVYHKFFIFNIYIAHWQHVDLLNSSFRKKETFNPSFTLPDIRKQSLRAALEKKSSYYPGLIFVKHV